MHLGKWLLRSSNIFCTFFTNVDFFFMILSEIITVLLEIGIDLGLLKKALLKTSKIILMCSNSLARQFSSIFQAKCLLPRLDKLLLVRSWLKYFYLCIAAVWSVTFIKTNIFCVCPQLIWFTYLYSLGWVGLKTLGHWVYSRVANDY